MRGKKYGLVHPFLFGFILMVVLAALVAWWPRAAAAWLAASAASAAPASVRVSDSGASAVNTTATADANCRYGAVAEGQRQLDWLPELGVGLHLNFDATSQARADNVEFIPVIRIRQNKDANGNYLPGYTTVPLLADLDGIIADNPGRLWIVGNEVDRGPNPGYLVGGQDDTFPAVYATAYHDIYHFIKARDPQAQVANSALVQVTPGRLQYLDLVWDAYVAQFDSPMPVDVWNMHLYVLPEVTPSGEPNGIANVALGTEPALGKRQSGGDPAVCAGGDVYCWAEHDDMTVFAEQVEAMRGWMRGRGQQNKPLILSEFSIIYPFEDYDDPSNPTTCFLMDEYGRCFTPGRVKAFMAESFAYLESATDPVLGYPADGHRLVQQWIWFSLYHNAAGDVSNVLTANQTALTEVGAAFQGEVAARPLSVNLLAADVPYPLAFTTAPGGTADVTLTVAVANNGNQNVIAPLAVTFYANEGLTQAIGSATVASVGGCARALATASVTWSDRPPGRHRFWVKMDSSNALIESNENDNVASAYALVDPQQVYLPLAIK